MIRATIRWTVAIGLLALFPSLVRAEPPSARGIEALIAQLDSDRFEVRTRAEAELESLVARPELAAQLTQQFTHVVRQAEVSFEVRSRLRGWLKRLPPADLGEPLTPQMIDHLLDQTKSELHSVRAAARERLVDSVREPRNAVGLMLRLRNRLANAALPQADYDDFVNLYERARGAWLMADPSQLHLPAVAEEEIARALTQLTAAAPVVAGSQRGRIHSAAQRQLLDWLCQDELVPQIKTAIEARLANAALDGGAQERLRELLEWTQPALVAEIWKYRQQIAEQNLLVDVPRQSLNALRPSHFSRIDDRTATCVSGQNLTPGEYPVGLAIAHPADTNWMCHLVNLPTPRRRMRYTYDAKRPEPQRLAELTERTLRAWTTERTYLTDLQVHVLEELHPPTVSRLIGEYFLSVDDRRQEQGSFDLGGANVSHHGRVCFVLAQIGTRESAPRLLEALRKQRFLPPRAAEAPYDWPWIAALTIAHRDPWPEVDEWLASLLDRREPLLLGRETEEDVDRDPLAPKTAFTPPELGATATAMLLERHQRTPAMFGLQSVDTTVLRNAGCPAYRYTSGTARQEVFRWWETQRRQAAHRDKTP